MHRAPFLLVAVAFTVCLLSFSIFSDAYSPSPSYKYPKSSMAPLIERSGDGTITVSPANEADQSALVVICHGLGDSSEGFADGESSEGIFSVVCSSR